MALHGPAVLNAQDVRMAKPMSLMGAESIIGDASLAIISAPFEPALSWSAASIR